MRPEVDQIRIKDEEQLRMLLQWRKDNLEAVSHYKDVMTEGYIVANKFRIYFKVEGEFTTYEYSILDEVLFSGVTKKHLKWFTVTDTTKGANFNSFYKTYIDFFEVVPDDIKELDPNKDHVQLITYFLRDNTVIHATLMAYILYLEDEVTYIVEEYTPPIPTGKHVSHNKYRPLAPVVIKRRIVRLKTPSYRPVTKKDFHRVTESWRVKGHIRHYKSGKTTWVEPYVKGTGKIQSKTYEIDTSTGST